MQIDIDIFYRLQSHLTSQTEHQSRLGIAGVSIRDRINHIRNLNVATTLIITSTNKGVARIFNWGKGGHPNNKSHAMTSSEIFKTRNLLLGKDTVE